MMVAKNTDSKIEAKRQEEKKQMFKPLLNQKS